MEALTENEFVRWLAELGWIDRVALGVVTLAMLRGLWIGLLREAFSLAALAAAFVAVRLWTDPTAAWLMGSAPFGLELSQRQASIAGGLLVGLGAMLVVVAVGGFVRKRVHATSLGLLDRLLGGALGGAEGALLVGLALVGFTAFVGADHDVLAGSRSIELLAEARSLAGELPDVAAPPPSDDFAPEDEAPFEEAEPPADDEVDTRYEYDFSAGAGDEVSV
ncbi:MAG: CvpA family protein [Deltaproteobacteria bacterium]|nr:CvpA family protein [Deltaproteobacteria bacterium]